MIKTANIITDAELMRLSSQNPELRFERNANGTLVTMPPTGRISSNREAKAIAYLLTWVNNNNLGEVLALHYCGMIYDYLLTFQSDLIKAIALIIELQFNS